MSPSSKMGEGGQQQRWDFRRRNDDIDSSSDESESSSEAALKKHKLVSSSISLENDEATGTCGVQQTGMCNAHTEDKIMSQKGKRMRSKKDNWINSDMERDSCKEVSRKKSKTNVYDPAALDELKIFMGSILEDLKVTRENLLSWMRKEMQKLAADDVSPRLQRRKRSSRGKNIRVQNGDNFEENTISKENIQLDNKHKFEENILIQHENNFEKYSLVQRDKSEIAQHHNNLKEMVQAQHQDNFEEVNVQVNYRNNFEPDMKPQQCDIGSLERSVETNAAAGYNNCYPVKPNLKSCFADNNVWMHEKNYLSGTRGQTYNYRSLESTSIGKTMAQSTNCHPLVEHRVNCVQEIGLRTLSNKERGGRLGLSIESNFPSNISSQVASSMYLTLPTVLTKPCGENHMLSTSSSNYIQTPVRNKLDVNSGKSNPMLKANGHHGNFSGLQQEQRNGSFAQIGSRNMSCLDKQIIPSSSIGTGFPVQLHQGMDIGVRSIPNQVSFDYLPREEKNILGFRIDEGASRFSGGSYATSEDYLANNFYSHSISQAHGRLKAFQNQDLEGGHLF